MLTTDTDLPDAFKVLRKGEFDIYSTVTIKLNGSVSVYLVYTNCM